MVEECPAERTIEEVEMKKQQKARELTVLFNEFNQTFFDRTQT